MVVAAPRSPSAVDARTLSVIAGACRDQEVLQMRYQDHSGTASARQVEPHRLVNTGQRWYLVAWDRGRRDWRTFRVDRIQERPQAGARFAPRNPPAADLAVYVARGAWLARPCRAKVKLFAAAEVIAERLPPGIGMIEAIDATHCVLDTGAATYETLAIYLVLLGVDFEISGPPELRNEIRKLAGRYRRATSAFITSLGKNRSGS
jgi:predicted DNA-binding transcriptional regulator YafY